MSLNLRSEILDRYYIDIRDSDHKISCHLTNV